MIRVPIPLPLLLDLSAIPELKVMEVPRLMSVKSKVSELHGAVPLLPKYLCVNALGSRAPMIVVLLV